MSSIAGHIIGLGDRHLDNILFEPRGPRRGSITLVDYAVCFDKGRRLRVPETVPFRLTPMLVEALGPMGVRGVFATAAESGLRVLRENRESVLTLLEAFAYDPLVDWTDSGLKERMREWDECNMGLSLFSSRVEEVRVGTVGLYNCLAEAIHRVCQSLGDAAKADEAAVTARKEEVRLAHEFDEHGSLASAMAMAATAMSNCRQQSILAKATANEKWQSLSRFADRCEQTVAQEAAVLLRLLKMGAPTLPPNLRAPPPAEKATSTLGEAWASAVALPALPASVAAASAAKTSRAEKPGKGDRRKHGGGRRGKAAPDTTVIVTEDSVAQACDSCKALEAELYHAFNGWVREFMESQRGLQLYAEALGKGHSEDSLRADLKAALMGSRGATAEGVISAGAPESRASSPQLDVSTCSGAWAWASWSRAALRALEHPEGSPEFAAFDQMVHALTEKVRPPQERTQHAKQRDSTETKTAAAPRAEILLSIFGDSDAGRKLLEATQAFRVKAQEALNSAKRMLSLSQSIDADLRRDISSATAATKFDAAHLGAMRKASSLAARAVSTGRSLIKLRESWLLDVQQSSEELHATVLAALSAEMFSRAETARRLDEQGMTLLLEYRGALKVCHAAQAAVVNAEGIQVEAATRYEHKLSSGPQDLIDPGVMRTRLVLARSSAGNAFAERARAEGELRLAGAGLRALCATSRGVEATAGAVNVDETAALLDTFVSITRHSGTSAHTALGRKVLELRDRHESMVNKLRELADAVVEASQNDADQGTRSRAQLEHGALQLQLLGCAEDSNAICPTLFELCARAAELSRVELEGAAETAHRSNDAGQVASEEDSAAKGRAQAVAVLRAIRGKLSSFERGREVGEVARLVSEATSEKRLAAMYEGWMAWI